MSSVILEIKQLRKAYGTTIAVDDVSFTLRRGEFLSLLGPSGSGKTTTLNMIAGLIEPTSGDILLNGQPITALPTHRRNIGMVFQNYALFPHMSVAENVAFPLEMRRLRKADIRTRVEKALALVGLPQHGNRLPRQLSGGQQQRVALARAVVFEPPILLMDEPLGALDKKLREQMQIEIMSLHKQLRTTVVYVTHDQDESLTMSDRIAVFNEGRMVQVGTSVSLYEEPKTSFVAGFIGETNLLVCTASRIVDGGCIATRGDFVFRGRTSDGVQVGSLALLSIRPERIRISTERPNPCGQENQISGVVRQTIYLGQSRKYVVESGGLSFVVLQQVREGDAVFEAGAPAHLEWNARDAIILNET